MSYKRGKVTVTCVSAVFNNDGLIWTRSGVESFKDYLNQSRVIFRVDGKMVSRTVYLRALQHTQYSGATVVTSQKCKNNSWWQVNLGTLNVNLSFYY